MLEAFAEFPYPLKGVMVVAVCPRELGALPCQPYVACKHGASVSSHGGFTVINGVLCSVKIGAPQVGGEREGDPCNSLLVSAYLCCGSALLQVLKAVAELADRAQGNSAVEAAPYARVRTTVQLIVVEHPGYTGESLPTAAPAAQYVAAEHYSGHPQVEVAAFRCRCFR